MTPTPVATDLVLLGAGHAHVEVLRRFAMRPMPGIRLTLVAREGFTPYSGMLPGLIRGEHGFDAAHLDCAKLAAASGARLILGEATAIDLARREVQVAGRPALGFDLLSVDVGGLPAMPPGGGTPVKPIGRFLARLAEIERDLAPGQRIAVVGTGAAGCELAIALALRLAGRADVVLVGRTAPMEVTPGKVQHAVQAALAKAGVEVATGAEAGAHDGALLALSDGRTIAATHVLWATGVVGPAFLAASGLACDDTGCIRVDASLRSVSHPAVFAAGDCAAMEGAPRPKAGVWAVRAGAPLFDNLVHAARGAPLMHWAPQRHALAILGLGRGRAVAWRGGWAHEGRLAHWLKRRIDRRWMAMYQGLRPMALDDPMRCGGCGAKIGPEALAEALAGLAEPPRADIPVGLAEGDDAAVTLPPAGMAVVQSVDHFRAFLDDPYVFGRIAAAHALSDIHAMGARPWTAMAIAALPFMPGRRMGQDLRAMMLGATEVLRADGCALVGGHSAEGAEASLGFAVTGLAAPDALWRKGGLRPGDALVLTKPLGTGIVLAAQMQGLARVDWLAATLASMARSNGAAAAVLRRFAITACTDVTGFGLGGHLMEMLRASGVAAELVASLPALPGARELAAGGVASTLAPANRAWLDLGDGEAVALLSDPQTSGGLLAGVPAEQAEACVAALVEARCEAWVVGRAVAGSPDITHAD
ncbi:MAG: selenide, water dikinase SelD [Alphaproteobacteria bacterium]|nr:selenide, water dikinase SelD [Alphaproteobacteria bacterium]